jgi:hypothetical protein
VPGDLSATGATNIAWRPRPRSGIRRFSGVQGGAWHQVKRQISSVRAEEEVEAVAHQEITFESSYMSAESTGMVASTSHRNGCPCPDLYVGRPWTTLPIVCCLFVYYLILSCRKEPGWDTTAGFAGTNGRTSSFPAKATKSRYAVLQGQAKE